MDRRLVALVFLIASFGFENLAYSNPRSLPFTYPYGTLPEGEIEVEQLTDIVPSKVTSLSDGNDAWVPTLQFQTELEWGITNRTELAVYAVIVPGSPAGVTPSAPLTERNGAKQRIRHRFFDEGVLPIDLAFYFELVENVAEFEVEAKIIASKRFGRLSVVTNLWAEREFYYDGRGEWVLNPTLGATFQVAPWLHVGAESWMRVEFPDKVVGARPFGIGPHVYAGPAVMFSFGRVWMSTGVYFRASDATRNQVPSEGWGPVWVRTVFGIEL